MRSITLTVDDRVYAKLTDMARKRSYTTTTYAQMLFDAAYASRVGVMSDVDIDAQIARAIILHGSKQDTAVIAKAVGLSESTVTKVIGAWRSERLAA